MCTLKEFPVEPLLEYLVKYKISYKYETLLNKYKTHKHFHSFQELTKHKYNNNKNYQNLLASYWKMHEVTNIIIQ